MITAQALKKAQSTKSDIRWYRWGILAALIAIVMNVNTLLFKATLFIRGDLNGEQLELALLSVVAFHSLIAVGQGYLLFYLHKRIKELKDG